MATLVTTITETLRYRGKIGQWSWVFHRLSGLGIVLFVYLHIIDTSWAAFYPKLYAEAIHFYQSPLFTLGEFFLVAAVVYHAINGYRIIYLDWRPELWHLQQRAAGLVFLVVGVILIPAFILMFSHVLKHYDTFELGGIGNLITGNDTGEIASLGSIISGQVQFALGLIVTIVVALALSFGLSLVQGQKATSAKRVNPKRPSEIDVWFWKFMRISGLLILPLVFGHLAAMHVIQGVFDLTGADKPIVGTNERNVSIPVNADGERVYSALDTNGEVILLDGEPLYFESRGLVLTVETGEDGEVVYTTPEGETLTPVGQVRTVGSALAFVGARWDHLVAGVAVWRFYDGALLALIVLHGFYGLYLVMRDYVHNLIVRRALTWSIIFGAGVLILVGSAALMAGVEETARDIVVEALHGIEIAVVE